MDKALTARLKAVADKQEIHDVIMRFCRGVDRLDEELLRSCYHDDSYDDHGHYKGDGQPFAAYIVKSLKERTRATSHRVANVLIELYDGDPDSAHAESYVLAYLLRKDAKGGERLDMFAGRYIDCFARRDGVWRIASRVVVHDWSRSAPSDDEFSLPTETFVQGRRDRNDLVYRSLAERPPAI